MHFHPKDTYEAFKPAEKDKIAHLAYHIHFNQMTKVKDRITNKIELKKIRPIKEMNNNLLLLARTVEQERSRRLAELSGRHEICQLQGKIRWRLVAGLGSPHVRETALTIHPVYGILYVPGSSLKGLVRNWFIHAYCDGDEKKLSEHPEAQLIFGTGGRRGLVQFYDIFLYEGLQIDGDIMAIHFKEYYDGNKPATEDQRLILQDFWAVRVDHANIFLTLEKKAAANDTDERKMLETAAAWTAQALKEFGIGAKTSLGYGVFSEVKDVTETEFRKFLKEREEMLAKEEARKKELEIQNMSPEDRLVYFIEQLTDNVADIEKSKGESIYSKVLKLQSKKAAQALKQYWEKTGQWKVKKGRKQFEKVQAIKEILQKM